MTIHEVTLRGPLDLLTDPRTTGSRSRRPHGAPERGRGMARLPHAGRTRDRSSHARGRSPRRRDMGRGRRPRRRRCPRPRGRGGRTRPARGAAPGRGRSPAKEPRAPPPGLPPGLPRASCRRSSSRRSPARRPSGRTRRCCARTASRRRVQAISCCRPRPSCSPASPTTPTTASAWSDAAPTSSGGAASRAAWLEAAASSVEAGRRLGSLPGIGAWTTAEVLRSAWGDPDALSVGDYHVPSIVAWALAGEPRADDARMLELLEPYRGQRGRVQRLLEVARVMPPRYGPRLAPRSIAAI